MVIFANVREYNYFLKSSKRIFELAHLAIFDEYFPNYSSNITGEHSVN